MRKAIVAPGGAVENIVVAGPDWAPPAGRVAVADDGTGQVGGTFDGSSFHPPPPVAPSPDPQAALEAAIAAAATLDELKAALLGQGLAGKIAGRPA